MELYLSCRSVHSLPESADELVALIGSLPFGQAEASHLLRITHTSALRQSLCGKLALWSLLRDRNLPPPYTILRTETGKPFFEATHLPAFSISHSETLALAVLSDRNSPPTGADLQFIDTRRNTQRLASHYFTPREREEYATAKDPQAYFFRRFTQKEAIAKQSGEGLAMIIRQETENTELFLQTLMLRHEGRTAYVGIATPEEITLLHFIDSEKELSYDRLSY